MNTYRLFNKIFGAVIFFLPGLVLVGFTLYANISGNEEAIEGGAEGFAGMLIFGLVFMGIGVVLISDAARLKFTKMYAAWNRGFRLGFVAFLVAGLAALFMAYAESAIYLVFGFAFTLVGGIGLFNFYRKEARIESLLHSGQKVVCTEIEVAQMTRSYGFMSSGRPVPYIIKCSSKEPGSNQQNVFLSDLIWFDPRPNLPGSITVYVNPLNFKEYKMDTSFLPKD